jgi:hypothetical protein
LRKLLIFIIFCSFWHPLEVVGWGIDKHWASGTGGSDSGEFSRTDVEVNRKMPRILVLVEEQNIGQEYPICSLDSPEPAICEGVIRSRFTEEGFSFIDHMALTDKISAVKPCSNEYAVDIGDSVDAELVIVSKVLAKCTGNIAGTIMKSFQASITGKAIRTDNGAVIASASAHGSSVDMDDLAGGTKAMEKAADHLANLLMPQIIDRWREQAGSITMIDMTVHGIKRYSDFVGFKSALETKLRGVKNICPKKIESGTVTLGMEIRGDAQSLADELAVKNLGCFSLEIMDVSRSSIELKVEGRRKSNLTAFTLLPPNLDKPETKNGSRFSG